MPNLDRAPHAYRMGYWDACAGRPYRENMRDGVATPFAGHDYDEGYKAGFNDAVYWPAMDENKRREKECQAPKA